jgi:hypothetical protein
MTLADRIIARTLATLRAVEWDGEDEEQCWRAIGEAIDALTEPNPAPDISEDQ